MPDNTSENAENAETAGSIDHTAPAAQGAAASRGRQQVKVGRVVSEKMDKTVVVAVENVVTHRLDLHHVADVVEIVSSRPLSATKRWRVRRILKRAE